MSRITDLGNKLEHLPNILTEYDNIINEAKDNIIIKGKTLETANRENPSWHGYYDTKRVELTILVKHMEAQVAKVRSELFRSLSDYNQREMSDNAKNKILQACSKSSSDVHIFLNLVTCDLTIPGNVCGG